MMSSSQTEATSGQHGAPAPPVFLRKLRRAAVATGCDVRLRVTVGGHPQPTLHWYRNDDLLPSDDQDYGGLWIRDCHQTDGGLYTCVAINPMGEARTSAVLAVLDLGEECFYVVWDGAYLTEISLLHSPGSSSTSSSSIDLGLA
ncbi:hypothetical protein AOLI_G00005010 [Acnodon oligacanthus]